MIDTAKFYFHLTDSVLDKLLDKKVLKLHGINLYGNGFYLKHPFGHKNPKVLFNLKKRIIWIETSLPKLLQGHNVFGINNLEFLCLETVKLIYSQLGIEWTREEQELIEKHDVRLGRLDITASYLMEFPEQVPLVLSAIFEHLRANSNSWSGYGGIFPIETVYHQQHSKRWSAKFYNKRSELTVNEIPFSVPERDRILAYASRVVRFELTFRAKELTRMSLQHADQWSSRRVIQTLRDQIVGFAFPGMIKSCLEPTTLNDLTRGCQTFYRLWRRGANLRGCRDYPPINRAHKHLLAEYGIDIYRHPRMGSPIPLNELLTNNNAYFVGPKALTRRGAIFGIGSFHR